MTRKLLVAAYVALLASACEMEQTEWLPPPDDPTIVGANTDQAGAICDEPAAIYCERGYRVEMSGERLYCTLVVGCPVVANPCKRGEPMGDPTFMVRCKGAEP